jgi:putative transposase
MLDRANYQGLELDATVGLIRGLIPLGLVHVQELLDEEVRSLAGSRYVPGEGYVRHRSNPGSVRLGGQRLPIRMPRVRGEEGEIWLRAHAALQGLGEVNEVLLSGCYMGSPAATPSSRLPQRQNWMPSLRD